MKYLVDSQLPSALARALESLGHDAIHVRDVGLSDKSDGEIWNYALSTGSIIISKDADFKDWSITRSPAPQVVWVRGKNLSRPEIVLRFSSIFPVVVKLLEVNRPLVEVWLKPLGISQ